MKKFLLVIIASLIIIFMSAGIAFANYGVHGTPGNNTAPFFTSDTDACAGCHRAHTGVGERLAFAIGPTQTIGESEVPATTSSAFCLVCHGTTGTLADTDVINGVFHKNRKVPPNPSNPSVGGGSLNGGGFMKIGNTSNVTSIHKVEDTVTVWGGGKAGDDESGTFSGDPNVAGTQLYLTCGSCHDPHGSPNYRLLNPNITPGKTTDVGSNEDGTDPMTGKGTSSYSPTYTEGNPTDIYKIVDRSEDMSGWCTSCHKHYMKDSTYKTLTYNPTTSNYEWQTKPRFRHSITRLSGYTGPPLHTGETLTTTLPLDKFTKETSQDSGTNYLSCLTCHRAHGTDAEMSGAAAAGPGGGGIPPVNNSVLLRRDNRGVCEDCHKR